MAKPDHSVSIIRSAITDDQGNVDVGYLSLMWGLVGWTLSIATILAMGGYAVWRPVDGGPGVDKVIEAIGSASIGISAGFASMLGAVGLFRLGDKAPARAPGAAPGQTVTATATAGP